jgi:hypothetical protein
VTWTGVATQHGTVYVRVYKRGSMPDASYQEDSRPLVADGLCSGTCT